MRLTNALRKDIVEKESAKKFHDKITEAESALKMEIDKKVAASVPKWITQKMIDSTFINTTNSIELIGRYSNQTPEQRVFNRTGIDNYYPIKNHSSHSVKLEGSILRKTSAVVRLNKEKSVFEVKLRNVLYSFSTIKKLVENLPELKEYCNGLVPTAKAMIPVAQIKEVRKMLVK